MYQDIVYLMNLVELAHSYHPIHPHITTVITLISAKLSTRRGINSPLNPELKINFISFPDLLGINRLERAPNPFKHNRRDASVSVFILTCLNVLDVYANKNL